jgi:hypothetical protein
MGRTIPSLRIALKTEEHDWRKPFRNALDKSERKKFDDEMFELLDFTSQLALLYGAAHKALYPILMSILRSTATNS